VPTPVSPGFRELCGWLTGSHNPARRIFLLVLQQRQPLPCRIPALAYDWQYKGCDRRNELRQ